MAFITLARFFFFSLSFGPPSANMLKYNYFNLTNTSCIIKKKIIKSNIFFSQKTSTNSFLLPVSIEFVKTSCS